MIAARITKDLLGTLIQLLHFVHPVFWTPARRGVKRNAKFPQLRHLSFPGSTREQWGPIRCCEYANVPYVWKSLAVRKERECAAQRIDIDVPQDIVLVSFSNPDLPKSEMLHIHSFQFFQGSKVHARGDECFEGSIMGEKTNQAMVVPSRQHERAKAWGIFQFKFLRRLGVCCARARGKALQDRV